MNNHQLQIINYQLPMSDNQRQTTKNRNGKPQQLTRKTNQQLITNFKLCLLTILFSLPSLISFGQNQKNKQGFVNQVAIGNAGYDSTFLQGLKYRLAGPYRGGRVTAVTGVANDILTYYFGSTGGGMWKTSDGGTSWKNISDGYFACAPIGSVEVAPSDNNVVYVGTGSAAVRGNISIGCGMYKSTDAGNSWKSIGLPKAGQIGRIA
ncbi:MAG: hypothetical protein MUE81_16050, partial [Thermoflexibacter sp.]|nr:hypothetical protein [Thermoflexibacter sp.]